VVGALADSRDDNWVSTSKTVPLVWTYTVAAALLSFLIARWMGHPGAYGKLANHGLNAEYALLIGGLLGAAILAKGIVSAQISSGATAKPPADNPLPPSSSKTMRATPTLVTCSMCFSTWLR
jgi:hypothetical protein